MDDMIVKHAGPLNLRDEPDLLRRGIVLSPLMVGALGFGGVVVQTEIADADTPAVALGAAAIGGAAVVGAAAIGAAGAVAAAGIVGAATIISAAISSKSSTTTEGEGGKKTQSTESPPAKGGRTAARSVLPIGPVPKTLAELIRQRQGKYGFPSSNEGGPMGRVDYDFEADIVAAPPRFDAFVHSESFVIEADVAGDGKNPKDAIGIVIDRLKLSTKDIPGSVGYSQITISSRSGRSTSTWKARVDQGKAGKHDKVIAEGNAFRAGKDTLDLTRPCLILIPVELAGGKEGKVRIEITYEGAGKRT